MAMLAEPSPIPCTPLARLPPPPLGVVKFAGAGRGGGKANAISDSQLTRIGNRLKNWMDEPARRAGGGRDSGVATSNEADANYWSSAAAVPLMSERGCYKSAGPVLPIGVTVVGD
ncbi:hypothetical protein AXG93_1865s1320 [Marchantia polymorpha subsp. ruderalis]|uniref:Uncharacterized protein n=1 Tax=Marchantia polymorpha subsp. ruderalis TaxID=1480154 RepID=A0A176WHA8_MARPO|nr:hypothetical protein AXG93_1865s1320 [Marchantia polymorpha subsp. ruderalis]